MQTFLPYPDFHKSASVLDPLRLGNQRNEALVILQTLDIIEGQGVEPRYVPWGNHPATRMWSGFRPALAQYGLLICLEYRSRGFDDSQLDRFATLQSAYRHQNLDTAKPWWLGLPALHRSHQSSLTAKDPGWYKAFWDTPPNIPTFWPVGPALIMQPF